MISAWALCVTVLSWGSATAGLLLVADMINTDVRCRRAERAMANQSWRRSGDAEHGVDLAL